MVMLVKESYHTGRCQSVIYPVPSLSTIRTSTLLIIIHITMLFVICREEVEMAPAMTNSAAKGDAGVLQWLKNLIENGKDMHYHVLFVIEI